MENDIEPDDIKQLSKNCFIFYFDNTIVLTKNTTFILKYKLDLDNLYIYNFKKSKSIAHIINTILKKHNNFYLIIKKYQQTYAKTKEEKRSLYQFIVNHQNKDLYLSKLEELIKDIIKCH